MTAEFYALKGMFLAQINKYVCYIGLEKLIRFLESVFIEAIVKVKLKIGMIQW